MASFYFGVVRNMTALESPRLQMYALFLWIRIAIAQVPLLE